MTEETTTRFRHRWRDKVKSEDGPNDAMLRHVLLVLGDWSPARATGPVPFSVAVSTLCRQTALKDSAVRERLAQAKGVWITEELRPGKTTIYRLRIPAAVEAARPLAEVRGGTRSEAGWPPDPTAGAGDPERETLPPARETPTAGAGDHPTAHAAGRRKETSPSVARPRARSLEGLAQAAPDAAGGVPDSPPRSRDEKAHTDAVDDQLECARLILEAVRGGRKEDFEAASELLAERDRRRKAGGAP